MPQELFTPNEARRTLPLVRRIVADLLSKGRELRELADASGADAELAETRQRSRELETELTEHLRELEAIGCEYKDWNFEHGLVDFPGTLDGHPVLWCWRTDEDDIGWYHGLEAGFAGRMRIPAALLSELTPSSAE